MTPTNYIKMHVRGTLNNKVCSTKSLFTDKHYILWQPIQILARDNLTVNNVKKKNPYLGSRQKYVVTIEYLRLSLQLRIKVNISRDYIQ